MCLVAVEHSDHLNVEMIRLYGDPAKRRQDEVVQKETGCSTCGFAFRSFDADQYHEVQRKKIDRQADDDARLGVVPQFSKKGKHSGNGESGNRNVVGSELIMKLIVVV